VARPRSRSGRARGIPNGTRGSTGTAEPVHPEDTVLRRDSRLNATREGDAAGWCRLFAEAIERAARKASGLATRLAALQERWSERADRPRSHSSAEALVVELPAHPIVTVAAAQKLLGRSKQAVNEAIGLLAEKGVLHPVTLARRNRAWEARELFALIDEVERRLATPEANPCDAARGGRGRAEAGSPRRS
jgi:hypothetical protein